MILYFIKFEILSFLVWIFNFKVLYFVKKNLENYTTIFEFGRLHEFWICFYYINILFYKNIKILRIFSKFFSTDFVIIKKFNIKIWFVFNILNGLFKFHSFPIANFLNSIWTKGYYILLNFYVNILNNIFLRVSK